MEEDEAPRKGSPGSSAAGSETGSDPRSDAIRPDAPTSSGEPPRPDVEPEARPRTPSVQPGAVRASAPPPPVSGRANNHRLVFAALWIIVQAILVISAGRRYDGSFGFRMFMESSTIKVALYREIAGPLGNSRIHVDEGVWTARAPDGTVHRLTWYDRVPMPFWTFDRETSAYYGAATQLARLQGALDDVASHVPEDAETRRFILDVTIRRNGREPVVHELTSPLRTTTVSSSRTSLDSPATSSDGRAETVGRADLTDGGP